MTLVVFLASLVGPWQSACPFVFIIVQRRLHDAVHERL